ncbi:TIGR04168 family protein [Spirulina sp. CS-785/01]|uniref:TIGR04168 family protein n=1 Tax=Spirulina sp. CS-785/01 TaxID=3021716 RepID=UPI003FA6D011
MIGQQVSIAIVGDVHDQWEAEDRFALEHLGIDLVLFVGDFGNEAVEVVRDIAMLDIPYAVILGNHDAWFTASPWGRKKSPYDHRVEDRVQQQLDLLGDAHVGYGWRDFPQLGVSVVGSRPFSWGGQDWKNPQFYHQRYGIKNFQESTDKIVQAGREAESRTVLFLGHNGPFGLGDAPEDTCGRDWNPLGGDFGDPDLADAIAQLRPQKTIPLVTFGHMHHRLRHTQTRLRTRINTDAHGTVYLNAASVPRVMIRHGQRLRNFSRVTLTEGQVTDASLIWVDEEYQVASQETLYSTPERVMEYG